MTKASSVTHTSRIQHAARKFATPFVSTQTRTDAGAGSTTSEMFTTPEAAAYTKMAVPTLERFRLTGEGPIFAKLGGSVRYRRCDLDAWIESRLVRTTSQTP
jgi:predicted DNA-binding transcriptional regulator AlpA